MSEHLWWYVARASGIVAWFLAAGSVVWGLFVSTRLMGRKVPPAWLLDLHRWLGGLTVTFTLVHLAGLVGDRYVHFGVTELLVPLASRWHPWPVAWGIAAFYLMVAVQGTSLVMKRLPRKAWLWIHRSSYLLFLLATVHGLSAGTDARSAPARAIAIGALALALFLWLVRQWSPRGKAAARTHPHAARARHDGAPADAATVR